MSQKLKYLGTSIVLQEVPDEITLAINISGCPHRCEGCHSRYLWDYVGDYISDDLPLIINKYKDYITCVCFMGGDQNLNELFELANIVHLYGLKCCLYSGDDDLQISKVNYFDYVKIGSYRQELGGLSSTQTNQKMYKKNIQGFFEDITYRFQRKRIS